VVNPLEAQGLWLRHDPISGKIRRGEITHQQGENPLSAWTKQIDGTILSQMAKARQEIVA